MSCFNYFYFINKKPVPGNLKISQQAADFPKFIIRQTSSDLIRFQLICLPNNHKMKNIQYLKKKGLLC